MAHSRIFVLKDMNTDIEDIFELEFEELVSVCPIADYIDDDTNLDDDILWFENVYGIEIRKENGHYFINRYQFIDKLKKAMIDNIEEAKNILNNKPASEITDMDVFNVVRLLRNNDGFLFYFNNILLTIIDVINYLELSSDKGDIEIVKTYDYHY